jgi:hypothetical protein
MSKRSKRSGGRKNKSAVQPSEPAVSRGNGASRREPALSAAGRSRDEGLRSAGRGKPFKAQALEQLAGATSAVRSEMHELSGSLQTELRSELAGARKLARSTADGLQRAAQTAQRGLQTAGRGVGDAVRENPIPIAMAGIGLTWLAVSMARSASAGATRYQVGSSGEERDDMGGRAAKGGMQQAGDKLGGVLQRAKRAAGSAAESVQQAVGNVGASTGEIARGARVGVTGLTVGAGLRIEQLATDVQEQGRRVGTWVKQTAEERPLWLGVAAVATGAALGFALPSTQQEDRWVGGARDKLVSQVEGLAQEAMDKVESRVEGVSKVLGIGEATSKRANGSEGRSRKQSAQA